MKRQETDCRTPSLPLVALVEVDAVVVGVVEALVVELVAPVGGVVLFVLCE